MLIGMVGKRYVGKSAVSDILKANHGFVGGHAFNPGKAASRGYFVYCGASEEEAARMTDGDLKDVPSPYLPDNQTPRHWMEKFGKFMGTNPSIGPKWTLGVEIDRLDRTYGSQKDKVIDSVAYEADYFKSRGGIIVRVLGPIRKKVHAPETDAAQASVVEDYIIENSGDKQDLENTVLRLVRMLREVT